jgi:hypothetical protein
MQITCPVILLQMWTCKIFKVMHFKNYIGIEAEWISFQNGKKEGQMGYDSQEVQTLARQIF